ncbi:MAG TPA: cobalamin-binding protein [Gammaproteobacteria bacterium]|nr:cobalamin-binding protein [Gammaproteobacteria bacterium]
MARLRDGGAACGVVARPGRAAAAAVLLLPVWLAAAHAAGAVAARDDTGRRIHLPRPARRIVSLAPHVTETLFDLGVGNRVVGASRYSNYPPPAKRIPRVGGAAGLDYERILALHPDLVVAWASGTGKASIRKLRRLGLTVFVSRPRSFADIASGFERLGRLVGRPRRGRALAAQFRQRVAAIRGRWSHRRPVRVFYEIWNRPLMTVGGSHIISEAIRACGGRNVFGDLDSLAPRVATGAVLGRDPQAIVVGGPRSWLGYWHRWDRLTAVRDGNLFRLDPDRIQRPGPRIVEGTRALCRDLQQARQRLGGSAHRH